MRKKTYLTFGTMPKMTVINKLIWRLEKCFNHSFESVISLPQYIFNLRRSFQQLRDF